MFSSIRARLFVSFLLVIFLMVALGATTFYFVGENGRLVNQAIDQDFNASLAISRLAIDAQKIRRFEKEFFMYIGDVEKRTGYHGEWAVTHGQLRTQLEAMLADTSGRWTDEDTKTFRAWMASLEAYAAGFRQVSTDVAAGALKDPLAANDAIREAKDKFRVLVDGSTKGAAKRSERARQAEQSIRESNRVLTYVLVSTVGFSVLLCLMLALAVPRAITRPIEVLSDAANSMSRGDLSRIVSDSVGLIDFKPLAETLERMRISQKTLMERAALHRG